MHTIKKQASPNADSLPHGGLKYSLCTRSAHGATSFGPWHLSGSICHVYQTRPVCRPWDPGCTWHRLQDLHCTHMGPVWDLYALLHMLDSVPVVPALAGSGCQLHAVPAPAGLGWLLHATWVSQWLWDLACGDARCGEQLC